MKLFEFLCFILNRKSKSEKSRTIQVNKKISDRNSKSRKNRTVEVNHDKIRHLKVNPAFSDCKIDEIQIFSYVKFVKTNLSI